MVKGELSCPDNGSVMVRWQVTVWLVFLAVLYGQTLTETLATSKLIAVGEKHEAHTIIS